MALTLCVVGCGVAGGAFLVELANMIDNGDGHGLFHQIFLYEPQEELGRGIAYASNVGNEALTITPMSGVFPNHILTQFQEYCRTLPDEHWFNETWLPNWQPEGYEHADAVASCAADSCFSRVHLPRKLVGEFLAFRVRRALRRLRTAGIAVHHVRSRARAMEHAHNKFLVVADNCKTLADSVVLCPGSISASVAPTRAEAVPDRFFDSYEVGLAATLERIASLDAGSKIVVAGSNASALEILHLAARDIENLGLRIEIRSPSGSFPTYQYGSSQISSGAIQSLRKAAQSVRSETFSLILSKLLGCLEENDLEGALAYLPEVGASLRDIPNDERAYVVNFVMPEVVRAVRRVEGPYSTSLIRFGQPEAEMLKPSTIEAVLEIPGSDDLLVVSRSPAGDLHRTTAALVLNCTDKGRFNAATTLVNALIERHPTKVRRTPGQRGLITDDSFRVCDGVFAFGPLLAGYSSAERNIWHLESTMGIMNLAGSLCAAVVERCLEQMDA